MPNSKRVEKVQPFSASDLHLEVHASSPMLSLLLDKTPARIGLFGTAVLLGTIPLVAFGLASWWSNTWYLDTGRGFIQWSTFPDYWLYGLVFACELFAAKSFYFKMEDLFSKLVGSVLQIRSEDEKSALTVFLSQFQRELRAEGPIKRGVYLLNVLIHLFIVYSVFIAPFVDSKIHDYWCHPHYIFSAILVYLYFCAILHFIASPILWHIIIYIRGMMKFFRLFGDREQLKLRPLSPDKAGGLGMIGEIGFAIHIMIFLPSILLLGKFVSAVEFTSNNYIATTAYIPLVTALFFLPMGVAHMVMRKSKDRELETIGRAIEIHQDQLLILIQKQKQGDEDKRIEVTWDIIGKLKSVYDQIDAMPVWPFNTKMIAKFVTSIGVLLLPIIERFFLG